MFGADLESSLSHDPLFQ